MKTGYNENIDEIKPDNKTCYKLTPEEREVVLVMDDKDRTWHASCSSPTYMRKFERQGWKYTRTEYYKDGTVCTKFYEAPCKSISIGKYERPKRQSRVLSEEQKEKMQEGRKNKLTSQI
jgi:hypothetical protein